MMKTIGIIGGMSWESTATYYRLINEGVNRRLGGLHSAKILMHSVDFAEIEECQQKGDWGKASSVICSSAVKLEKAGADFLILCTNTMHKVADSIQEAMNIPLLHIADATAEKLKEKDLRKVGLLGTRYTMIDDFYTGRLAISGIDAIIPDQGEIGDVNSIIFDELCRGVVKEDSRRRYLEVIASLKRRGASGIILGCTEIGMLVRDDDVDLPVFDTTLIHAGKTVDVALGG